ncbi:DUF3306 domain-containing protein [Parasedimentitalea psychrophila]|uniref:DUF3306 domain-containing protein n=1 Tax=Parasedimentitalea psychrophila TaxID=2997337 RepID=A0A9Y2L0T2_9RHOB|nr:DUF3306 domain-containing protein [Parasedimentitalea psychrophila]WIY26048.1 DUF3306 domain-containing protein [Parasedimentitalea psychrophila]
MSGGDFWARRKAGVEAEVVADARAEDVALAEQRAAELGDKSDAELLAELQLPDPDSLGEGDDFTVFLTETIPARIRTRALRRLWLSNPVLANVDGLVDYGEDFTDAACAVENIQTAYQVGKGMTAHVDEMARQAAEEAEAQEAQEADKAAAEAVEDSVTEQPEPAAEALTAEVTAAPSQPEAAEIPAYMAPPISAPPPPRRMRFTFDEGAAKT